MRDNEIPGMNGLCWSDLSLSEDEIEDLKMSGALDFLAPDDAAPAPHNQGGGNG